VERVFFFFFRSLSSKLSQVFSTKKNIRSAYRSFGFPGVLLLLICLLWRMLFSLFQFFFGFFFEPLPPPLLAPRSTAAAVAAAATAPRAAPAPTCPQLWYPR
jgi:hypothetical protein